MTLSTLGRQQSPPSPSPESGEAAAERAAPEAQGLEPRRDATAKSPGSGTPPAKAPTASLVSIAGKNRPAAAMKSGDLTRLIQLARGQTLAGTCGEAPRAELSASPTMVEVERPVIEEPVSAAPLEPSPIGTASEPPSIEPPLAAEPIGIPELTREPPPLLAPTITAWDATVSTDEQPVPAPIADTPVVPEPGWHEGPGESAGPASLPPVEPPRVPEAAPPLETASPIERLPIEPLHAPVASPTPTFKELTDYWRSLRRSDDHPASEAVDRDLVTDRWPGTLLIAYTPASQDPRGEPRPGRVTRLGTACAETQSVVDAGSHSTEWMLEVARTALINDEPVEECQRLETLTGVAGFRMVALPLGPPSGLANAVLCALLPSPAAPRFGKRRTWL